MAGIKKIAVKELRVGMFLHGFDGPWMQTPFWRTQFLLRDPADIRKARASALESCWIDTDRGADVLAAPAPAPLAAPPQAATFGDELRRAAGVCATARAATVSMFAEARLGNAIDPQAATAVVDAIAESVLRHPGALISLARLKTGDDYTYMHSVAVCALMIALGRSMRLDDAACREAGLAGLLHDIGKVDIPPHILNKPGRLSEAEFQVVMAHPLHGHRMLSEGGAVSQAVLDVCLHHHEKIDGSGYPDRLAGTGISLLARMGAVCDVYDAVTSNRPYKAGWDPADSIGRMLSWKGHLDSTVLSAFIQTVGIYPTGSLVRLNSGRLAVVVEQNRAHLTRPVVNVFHCLNTGAALTPLIVNLAASVAADAIAAREERSTWDPALLEALWTGH